MIDELEFSSEDLDIVREIHRIFEIEMEDSDQVLDSLSVSAVEEDIPFFVFIGKEVSSLMDFLQRKILIDEVLSLGESIEESYLSPCCHPVDIAVGFLFEKIEEGDVDDNQHRDKLELRIFLP